MVASSTPGISSNRERISRLLIDPTERGRGTMHTNHHKEK